ncbi:lipase [Sphaerisporangium krabiense]|uniref:Triacylglycerol esterase/lipase EstA (Alpha/beta hydrolase family) n=1 Tax=Sphaerisporangium krabiense TaxID=763782 RepID=A0A7W8Z7S4_9ACTN|nr:alpha/beta fold hydrolase [Sphaerisporangium krabiense]MBB5628996.1 triacylglycerol esterase/lipase EstA (alpha/beta hydrolase family) [Sphaerisporangium krabiense]GII60164.1 lipase [Sphaerisporangium krabiense]
MRIRVVLSALVAAALVGTALTGPAHAGTSLRGANDWACVPKAAHPRPVILVHGTFATMAVTWPALSPALRRAGYCVFALDYGAAPGALLQGTGDIARSAGQLAAFVDRVLTATGAAKVDIVGHSQGGMMPRHYLRFLGGAAKVRKLVGLAPSNHGTTLGGLVALGDLLGVTGPVSAACPACGQQLAGSRFLAALNAGGEDVPGVAQTVIATRYDEVITPYSSSFLAGAGVRNVLVQRVCPLDFSAHLGLLLDPVVQRLVMDELDAPRGAVNCLNPLG